MMQEISKKFLQRSKKKTVLLCLLVVLINLFSILGISMYYNSVKLLEDANEVYTTLGVIEYTGGAYPDSTKMDEESTKTIQAFPYDTIGQQDEFVGWHKEYRMLGYVEGTKLGAFFKLPYTNFSVIRFKVKQVQENGQYYCLLLENLYSAPAMEGTSFRLSAELLKEGFSLKDETEYIACGDFRKENGFLFFTPVKETGMSEDADVANLIKDFPVREIEGTSYLTDDPEMEYWNQLIDYYTVQNGSFHVVAVDELEKQTEFYLGVADVFEGEIWSQEDVEAGKKVCVLHTAVATVLEKNVGDTICLNMHYSDDPLNYYGSYNQKDGFKQSQEYEIIGIYKGEYNTADPYIFVPRSTITDLPKDQPLYQLGNVEIKNGSMKSFEDDTKEIFSGPYRMTTYDQGYEKTVAPIYAMQRNSVLIMILCFVCDIIVIFLFATLQIVKQFDVVSILTSMGTGKKKCMEFLMWGAGTIGAIGCAIGAVVGYFLSIIVIRLAYLASVSIYEQDLRFSNLAMGVQKTFEANIRGSILVCLAVAVVIFVLLMLISYVFGNDIIAKAQNFGGQKKKKRKKKEEQVVTAAAVPKEHFEYRVITPDMKKYTSLGRGRFVFKQAFRGGVKNFRVNVLLFLIPMAIAVFMTVYTHTLETYKLSLEEVKKNTEVNAYLTTIIGRSVKLHNVNPDIVEFLEGSANVDRMYESASMYYVPVGKVNTTGGEDAYNKSLEELNAAAEKLFEVPTSGFAFETKVNKLKASDYIVTADDMSRSEEFFGNTAPVVTFMQGEGTMFTTSDGDFLQEPMKVDSKNPVIDGVLTDSLMKEYDLEFGDLLYVGAVTFELSKESGSISNFYPTMYTIRVVGSYKSTSGADNIYVPQLDCKNEGVYMNMRLNNNIELEGFRDQLEALGVSSVGYADKARISMIIEDKELIQSTNSINNNISFMTSLGAVLFVVIIVIGFVASFLSMRTRREEIAIIRSMGAGNLRTFLMFFVEQFFIGFLGTIGGLAISFLYTGELAVSQILIVGLFFLCFMFGSGLCIAKMNTKNVLGILSAAD